MFTSTWGFQYNFLFTIMLLDIFSINTTLRETVQSIGTNGAKIVMTIYLFFITALIYATYGLQFYEEDFEDGNTCDSTSTDQGRMSQMESHAFQSKAQQPAFHGTAACFSVQSTAKSTLYSCQTRNKISNKCTQMLCSENDTSKLLLTQILIRSQVWSRALDLPCGKV